GWQGRAARTGCARWARWATRCPPGTTTVARPCSTCCASPTWIPTSPGAAGSWLTPRRGSWAARRPRSATGGEPPLWLRRAHQADIVSARVLDDRVAGAPERVVRRLAARVPCGQQRLIPCVHGVAGGQREPEHVAGARPARVPDPGHDGVVQLEPQAAGEAEVGVARPACGRPVLGAGRDWK